MDQYFTKPTWWIGTETLKAVSLMLEINILVFTETGNTYFAHRFNPHFGRTLIIFFRISDSSNNDLSNAKKNQYGSVIKVDKNIVSEFVNDLIQKYLK